MAKLRMMHTGGKFSVFCPEHVFGHKMFLFVGRLKNLAA